MRYLECYFDGSCEPINPGGQMGYGFIIMEKGKNIYSYNNKDRENKNNTSNLAEYKALNKLLDYLLENKLDNCNILIKGDSQLVIYQMQYIWKIKTGIYVSEALICRDKARKFKIPIKFHWIPREQNKEADKLSKINIPESSKKEKFTIDTLIQAKIQRIISTCKNIEINKILENILYEWVFKGKKLSEKQNNMIETMYKKSIDNIEIYSYHSYKPKGKRIKYQNIRN